jgi:tetratricopeptide (TPR) repeat protein
MAVDTTQVIFRQGLEYLKGNQLEAAANAFRRAFKNEPENPRHLSYYGLIIALHELNYQDGVNFCRAAILRAAYEPEFYLNLCRVYSKAGQRKKALETLVEGLSFDSASAPLKLEMRRMGSRRKPAVSFLSRDHFLNRSIGKLTYQLRRGRHSMRQVS